jgi:nucleoside-diphosphate-sugar epimerase
MVKGKKAMKILVTGATGFIGRNLVRALVREGYDVAALVRRTSNVKELPKKIRLIEGDLNDLPSLKKAVEGRNVVVHLAAYFEFYPKDVDMLYQVNVEGTRNLLTACIGSTVKRFIYCSTTETTGTVANPPATEETELQPMYEYGKSKIQAENAIREISAEAGFDHVILRPVGVVGPGEFYLGFETIKAIANREISMIPGDGQNHVMYIHVDDVVKAFLIVVESKSAKNETFIISPDEPLTYEEVFNVVAEILGVEPPTRKVPVSFAKMGVGLIGFFKHRGKRTFLWHMKSVDALNSERWYSNEKAKRMLGWKPTMTMKETFRSAIEWYISEGHLKKKEAD